MIIDGIETEVSLRTLLDQTTYQNMNDLEIEQVIAYREQLAVERFINSEEMRALQAKNAVFAEESAQRKADSAEMLQLARETSIPFITIDELGLVTQSES